jgi:hypothetical protein
MRRETTLAGGGDGDMLVMEAAGEGGEHIALLNSA